MIEPKHITTTPGLPSSTDADIAEDIAFHSRAVDFMLSAGYLPPGKAAGLIFDPQIAYLEAESIRRVYESAPDTVTRSLRLAQVLNEGGIALSEIAEQFARYGDGFASLYEDLFQGDGSPENFRKFEEYEVRNRDALCSANALLLVETPRMPIDLHKLDAWAGFEPRFIEDSPTEFIDLVSQHGTGASSLYRVWGDKVALIEPEYRDVLQTAAHISRETRKDILFAVAKHLPTAQSESLLTLIAMAPQDASTVLDALPRQAFDRNPERYVEIAERFKGFATVIFAWFERHSENLTAGHFDRLEKLFGSAHLSCEESAQVEAWRAIDLGSTPRTRMQEFARIEELIGPCGPYLDAFARHFKNDVFAFFESHGSEAAQLIQDLEAADLDADIAEAVSAYPWGAKKREADAARKVILASVFSGPEVLVEVQKGPARQRPEFTAELIADIRGHAVPALKYLQADFIDRHPDLALRTASLLGPHGEKAMSHLPQDAILEQPERFAQLLDVYGSSIWGLIATFQGKLLQKAEELDPLLRKYVALTTDGAGDFFYRVPERLWNTPEMERFAARYAHAAGSEYYARAVGFSHQREADLWERSFSPARSALNAYHFGRFCRATSKAVDTSFLDSLVQNATTDVRSSEDSAAVAIVAHDHNYAFAGDSNFARLRRIDAHLKMFIREVSAAEEIAAHFEQSAQQHGKQHRLGMIGGHGFEQGVRCREALLAQAAPQSRRLPGDSLTVAHTEILERTGATIRNGGDFILACCLAARGGYGANNLLTSFKNRAPHVRFFATRIATTIGSIEFDTVIDRNAVESVTFGGPHRKRVVV